MVERFGRQGAVDFWGKEQVLALKQVTSYKNNIWYLFYIVFMHINKTSYTLELLGSTIPSTT